MYPAFPNTDINNVALVTLPDGRIVWARETGYVEGDTNAFVEGEFILRWEGPGGEDLTDEEFNSEIELPDGSTTYLHEYVSDNAEWEHDYWGDD